MDKIKEFLSGKKTYIIAGFAIIAVWLDFFFGIGFSDACKATAEATKGCSITFTEAAGASYAAFTAATLRAAIGKK